MQLVVHPRFLFRASCILMLGQIIIMLPRTHIFKIILLLIQTERHPIFKWSSQLIVCGLLRMRILTQ
ncbi:hypothetical protein WS93_06605 [Burkholderia cepacia]|uniref:Uncharacterized protein n=1 Tax=Burkholderia cepacia TaxID=292 RepID=A0A118KL14_BURCE|nr:hypothetical protein WS90_06930 [Burkholderia cepacia]KVL04355.1 hypothetical protein WS93_06605 [Burkholderia cepacia]